MESHDSEFATAGGYGLPVTDPSALPEATDTDRRPPMSEPETRTEAPTSRYEASVEAYLAGATRVLDASEPLIDGLADAALRLGRELDQAREQAVRWMDEATHQAAERDANYAEAERLRADLARVTGERDDALTVLETLKLPEETS